MTTTTIAASATHPTAARPRADISVRAGAIALGVGAVAMAAGGAVLATTGADIDAAVSDGTITEYLADAASHRSALLVNTIIWAMGVVCLGLGGVGLVGGRRSGVAAVTRAVYLGGSAVALVAFVSMMALVRVADTIDAPTAELVAFFGSTLDWSATIALVGVGPVLLAAVCRDTWMPRRLVQATGATALAAAATLVGLFAGQRTTYAMLLVPIGLVWTLAAAVAAARAPFTDPVSS